MLFKTHGGPTDPSIDESCITKVNRFVLRRVCVRVRVLKLNLKLNLDFCYCVCLPACYLFACHL